MTTWKSFHLVLTKTIKRDFDKRDSIQFGSVHCCNHAKTFQTNPISIKPNSSMLLINIFIMKNISSLSKDGEGNSKGFDLDFYI